MGEKIKVGVIGAGRIGKIHASNIIKNFPEFHYPKDTYYMAFNMQINLILKTTYISCVW